MKCVSYVLGILVVSAVLVSCTAPTDDASLKESLVGQWKFQNADFTAVTTYKADNTFEGQLMPASSEFKIDVAGTWRVENGNMVSTVTSSSAPEKIEVGFCSTDRLISISETERTFHDGNAIRKEIRIK